MEAVGMTSLAGSQNDKAHGDEEWAWCVCVCMCACVRVHMRGWLGD